MEVNPGFLNCDLKDNIELYLKGNGEIIFRGVIKESFVNGKKATVVAQDISLKLDYISIKGLAASKFLGISDLASLLISPVEELRVGNTPDIPDTTVRDFIIIIPIGNLILKERCSIGNVEFYKDFNMIDDKIISRSGIRKKAVDWNSCHTRAKVMIRASEFRTALIKGYDAISAAIDLIALRNDLSFPRLEISGADGHLHFQYHEFVAQVKIPTWVYCRENETDLYAIYNLDFLKENVLNLEHNQHEYFDIVDRLFSNLLHIADTAQDEKRILMAIHWLRRAIQNGDNKDKMLDLWTAMDFVMSGTKANQLFCDRKIDSITQLINSNLESLALTNEQKDALFKRIKMLNDVPLMARVEALKKKLRIDLVDEEIKLIKTARDKRNKIIHGEDIEINDSELSKLRSFIERLLIGKISLLAHSSK